MMFLSILAFIFSEANEISRVSVNHTFKWRASNLQNVNAKSDMKGETNMTPFIKNLYELFLILKQCATWQSFHNWKYWTILADISLP